MAKKEFTTTAYQDTKNFVFGRSLYPVRLKNGMSIGGGTVYPEVNFTLPAIAVNDQTMPEVLGHYKQIITGITERARDLGVPGFVAEIETLPPMTAVPQRCIDVCKVVVDGIKEADAKWGVKGAVRITPNDNREGPRLTHMWHGAIWDEMMQAFEGSAKVGADFLAIETLGGKEVHDEGLMEGNIEKSIFALAILGCRDMEKVWAAIAAIAEKTGTVAAGDTACAFANTAFALAEGNFIPKVFSATVRVMAAVRSLVANEQGALGPHKDCGYEGVYVKAIAGTPIATEGRIAAVAHLSPMGNVASCLCDLWSNESIQNIKLLGGMAPTCSFEQLVYDCRLMNGASAKSADTALLLRDLYADSDTKFDPQAYVLRPNVVLDIAKKFIGETNHYKRMKKAAEAAVQSMAEATKSGQLVLSARETEALKTLTGEIGALPADEGKLISDVIDDCEKLDRKKYDL